MPYIKQYRRDDLHFEVPYMRTPGELNYVLTRVALQYMEQHALSYDTINEISGAFNEALAEFRRRITVPYEDEKILENGDVYPTITYVVQP